MILTKSHCLIHFGFKESNDKVKKQYMHKESNMMGIIANSTIYPKQFWKF